jgi:protein TonB
MVKILVMSALLVTHVAAAQQAKLVHRGKKRQGPTVTAVEAPPAIYTIVEQRAEFPWEKGGLDKYLNDNLRYPEAASEAGIQGRVFVQFVIDEQGRVSKARVVRGISKDCDEEALRVVRAMPAWRPAKFNGERRSSVFVLPILFQKIP